jgi:hypothetical protein
VALGVCGFGPLMVADGPKGSQIPSSPMRRRVLSGRCAWWKVERGLDLLSASSWLRLYYAASITQQPWGVLRGLKGRLASSSGPLLSIDG